jgi:aspartyl-tRNA(Asn)/glutamyl-tRNA(Gln) amidotransferase subunit C
VTEESSEQDLQSGEFERAGAEEVAGTWFNRTVIERDQVLHVARLARLRLSEEEVERMSSELSEILDHVDRIAELDLEGVEPTSHVVALENVLRPDEPRPSWPRERILEPAPDPAEGAFRVPSPQAEA